jgi:hypothetical protein
MFGAVGMPVERLVRVRIGPLRMDRLATGHVRPLGAAEVARLGAGTAERADPRPSSRPSSRPSRRRVSSQR